MGSDHRAKVLQADGAERRTVFVPGAVMNKVGEAIVRRLTYGELEGSAKSSPLGLCCGASSLPATFSHASRRLWASWQHAPHEFCTTLEDE